MQPVTTKMTHKLTIRSIKDDMDSEAADALAKAMIRALNEGAANALSAENKDSNSEINDKEMEL